MAARQPEILISRMSVADLEQCYQIDQICFQHGEAYDRDVIRYLLAHRYSVSYKIVNSQQMLGFVLAIAEADGTGHVAALAVLPNFRRQGHARALMEFVESGFLAQKVSLIKLEVRVSNLAAQRLYRKLGYTIVERIPKYYSNGEDAHLCVKSLADRSPVWY